MTISSGNSSQHRSLVAPYVCTIRSSPSLVHSEPTVVITDLRTPTHHTPQRRISYHASKHSHIVDQGEVVPVLQIKYHAMKMDGGVEV
jgi:hypothetical protein